VVDDDSFDLIVFPSPFVAMPGNLIAFSVVQKSFFNKHGVRNAPILLYVGAFPVRPALFTPGFRATISQLVRAGQRFGVVDFRSRPDVALSGSNEVSFCPPV
jgi:hypothetical protein